VLSLKLFPACLSLGVRSALTYRLARRENHFPAMHLTRGCVTLGTLALRKILARLHHAHSHADCCYWPRRAFDLY
jgi:hypothetical protein